jgi:hypothetical protein
MATNPVVTTLASVAKMEIRIYHEFWKIYLSVASPLATGQQTQLRPEWDKTEIRVLH